ncbi:alpha/beta fold hydrolase [Bradyrhizobium sp. WYCCWR 13023]|uniref:Alpha/beta fold hydrolase n=1 Tax=Bradyrhizobium zhengyangense TaxID=2911009 RepID=A0A9X1RFC2_9BRAD|nr:MULTISPECIES: alpha/beta fold hydrolase [Bradyrhizobium]MCG2629589.1 alpha/beta fold hydrolase [Bradyrhizobium zhengyangense]MCG2643921.1 alpha/beta fold hydrolase [Bradyrhizobium zhengyangense]MCG2671110.1 alpha/beta fold hydrolase [Bradyrhizobium zhengyangense]MDA9519510.1 SARP family transcriptional regulator [Bradyrhizobium sp. CCBAU 11434]
MTAFSLGTFGFPEVHADGRPIKLALRKGLALLVYLAEAKGAVSRDVMATWLWPEADRETGLARLRRLLHRIELALGEPVFETDRTSMRWSPAVALTVDSHQFETACDRAAFEEACQIYRGDFLAGFSPEDSPEFDDWAFFRREALRGRLVHALERLVQDKNAAGDHFAATAYAGRLVQLDPLSEVYGRHLIRSLLLSGDRSAAERHHAALTQRLRDELGVVPEAETEALMSPAATAQAVPTTRYVKGSGVHLAYQTYGSGALDILVMPGFVSHVERVWEHPASRTFLASLMKLGRLIVFDRRGIGLSDRVGAAPGIDVTAEDIGTVLRAAESRRVVLFGASECGPACVKFAVDQPSRVAGLILFGALAKGCWAEDYPHALRASQYDAWRRQLVAQWGGPVGIEAFAPSLAGDPQARAWWAGLLRAASSPGGISAVLEAFRDADVRHLLPQITVPTLVLHRQGDKAVRIAAGRDVASRIPGAQFVELDGHDHWFFAGDHRPVLEAVRRFTETLQP